ncbi:MAG: hypothetical protein Q9182_007576, partial [Xanthomendoza sp. 2 TL-2023]
MEAVGLIYNASIQAVICIEHGYCLLPTGYKGHLRGLHGTKGSQLKAACEELSALELADLSTVHIPSGLPPIPYLNIDSGFQCTAAACNNDKRSLSLCKNTVEKHLSDVHNIGRRRGKILLQATDIRSVCMQSLLPKAQYKPFVVQGVPVPACSNLGSSGSDCGSPPLHATAGPDDSALAFLEERFASSEQQWKNHYSRLPTSSTENTSQDAPWLRRTGISRWVAGFELDKKELQSYMEPLACTTPGSLPSSINRVTARVLNSFEEGRIQSKAFHGVQEQSTMERYTKYWSRLIVFLLHAVLDNDESPFSSFYLDADPGLKDLLQTVSDSLHATLSTDLADVDFELLFSGDDDEGTPEIRLHALSLHAAIIKLSIHLVRFTHNNASFSSPIVGFMALNTLESSGVWIAAHNFTFVLSGIIHCMQLWLLGYCYQAEAQATRSEKLEAIVREQCQLFLINTTSTPMAELLYWRLLTMTASNDTVRCPVTTVNADCTQVTHLGIELNIEAWRGALQELLQSAETILEGSLLLDLPEVPIYDVASVVDTPNDSRPGKCFLDDPRNRLHAVDGYLFRRVKGDPVLTSRFIRSGATDPVEWDIAPTFKLRRSAFNTYFHANQQFLQQLGVLIYWSAGLPPRRKELIQVQWCNTEVARNVYILDGRVTIITGYHKSQWRIGTRPVARFLPPRLGNLLVRYLVYVPSFLRFLYRCTQRESYGGFLFSDEDGVWSPNQFGNQVKRQSTRLLGFQITSRQWRHISIALDRRLHASRACKVYGVIQQWDRRALHAMDQSDSELDPDYHMQEGNEVDSTMLSRARNFQASHTPATNQSTYGNDVTLTLGLTDALLAAYREVSQFWSRSIACVEGLESTASKHQRSQSGTSNDGLHGKKYRHHRGSSLTVRCSMWKWPVIEQALQRLFGLHAAPRNLEQRNGFLLVARCRPEAVIVLPTGSGKTLLFLIASQLPGAQVTIVIVPLIALRQDLRQRCTEWGIMHAIYDPFRTPSQLHAVPTLLLVDIEQAVTPGFLGFARALHAIGRLDRFVLDEAHLLLTASNYRPQLPLIAGLRRVRVPFICMTGTLPPFASFELENLLYFTQCERLRASSDRPNLVYCVQHLGPVPAKVSRNHLLIDHTKAACMQDIEAWSSPSCPDVTCNPTSPGPRGIIFVRTKSLGEQLSKELGCSFYHGDLSHLERETMVTAWNQGITGNQGFQSRFIVATSAFSAGVHYPSVRRVYHVDAPDGLLNYGQETGRAGRDGFHARCTVLLADGWVVSWREQYHNDFLAKDRSEMTAFLQFQGCRRLYLTAYLDGGGGTPCNQLSGIQNQPALCDNCSHPISRGASIQSRRGTNPAIPVACNHQAPRSAEHSPVPRPQTVACGISSPVNYDQQLPSPTRRRSPSPPKVRRQPLGWVPEAEQEASMQDTLSTSSLPLSAPGTDSWNARRVFDVAAQFARKAAMEKEELRSLYEQQLASWGRACILCSFARKELVEGTYKDCMQDRYRNALTEHRR